MGNNGATTAVHKKLFIPILLGTLRQGRESEKVGQFVLTRTRVHPEIETQFFDVRDMKFPFNDEGEELKKINLHWRDAIIRADGLIIISPEYNHGYPGSLKMTLDMLLKEYIHKAVALVGVSSGSWGGTRVIEKLVSVVRELGLTVTFTDLNVPKVETAFDDHGNPTDPAMEKRLQALLEELIWMSRVLCWGRANLPSKYHKQSGACRTPKVDQTT